MAEPDTPVTTESFSTFVKGETLLDVQARPAAWRSFGVYGGLNEDGSTIRLLIKGPTEAVEIPLVKIRSVTPILIFDVLAELEDCYGRDAG